MTAPATSRTGTPRLSVLIPFFRDDPSALARAVDAQAAASSWPVEIVLCDDGSGDAALTARLDALRTKLSTPLTLLTKEANGGRACARNALAAAAKGDWLLYLDADMLLPDGFLARWFAEIERGGFDAAFGGFDAEPPASPGERVHAAIARAGQLGRPRHERPECAARAGANRCRHAAR